MTRPTRIKGHVAKASPEHPEVLVKSDRTGAEAVHRPEELRTTKRGSAKTGAAKRRTTSAKRTPAKRGTAKRGTAKRTPAKKTPAKRGAAKRSTSSERETGDAKATVRAFRDVVNMTPRALERWLDDAESKRVGIVKAGARESVGHSSGRRIVELLRKRGDYDARDLAHMRKVVGYVRRHCAQGPAHARDIAGSRWAASLKNWGHDPTK